MAETPEELEERIAEWEREPSQVEIDDALLQAHRPGIMLNKTARPDDPGASGCWLGGEPTLPAEFDWPYTSGGEIGPGLPMQFLAQIDLAQVPRLDTYSEVPNHGTLYFFVEPIIEPIYGCSINDGSFLYLKEGGRTLYYGGSIEGIAPRKMPGLPELSEFNSDRARQMLERFLPFQVPKKWNLDFLVFDGLVKKKFSIRALESAIDLGSIEIKEKLKKITSNRRPGENGSCEFSPHHMFGNLGLRSIEDEKITLQKLSVIDSNDLSKADGSLIKLLAATGDEDIGYRSAGWTEYWISLDNLVKRDFSEVFVITRGN